MDENCRRDTCMARTRIGVGVHHRFHGKRRRPIRRAVFTRYRSESRIPPSSRYCFFVFKINLRNYTYGRSVRTVLAEIARVDGKAAGLPNFKKKKKNHSFRSKTVTPSRCPATFTKFVTIRRSPDSRRDSFCRASGACRPLITKTVRPTRWLRQFRR